MNQLSKFAQSYLYCGAPVEFQQLLFRFFRFYFESASKQFRKQQRDEEESEEEAEEPEEEPDESEEVYQQRKEAFLRACSNLNELYILHSCEPVLISVCFEQINKLVNDRCKSTGISFEKG